MIGRQYPVMLWLLIAAALCEFTERNGQAQPEPGMVPHFGEAVSLDTDSAAVKKLGAARDFLAARQWSDGVELLHQIVEQHGDRLIAVSPGRYVNVRTCCDMLLAVLPADGLKVYRARIDPQAKKWFETGKANRDEGQLLKVVRQAFASSYGDDALLLLGELAWERGAISRARSYWRKLVPLAKHYEPGQLPSLLAYPDSPVDPAAIRARLVLCSFLQGNARRGQRELRSFAELHPEAQGTLAGRTGNLAKFLQEIAAEVLQEPSPADNSAATTFAGNSRRNKVFPQAIDVGAPLWTNPPSLKEMRTENADRLPIVVPEGALSYYPLVFNDVVHLCDDTAIYAWKLSTGEPAWPAEKGARSDPAKKRERAMIYELPLERSLGIPLRQVVGLPWFTMTVDQGRLYARLGPVTAGRLEGKVPQSVLVCLDLTREGKLVDGYPITADDIEADKGGWSFEGSPIVADGRLYIALRRSNPQPQANVACFDAETGRLLWNRKVCLGAAPLGGEVNEISRQLLTLADDRLFYNTNLGAVAALDARDGTLLWVATYPHSDVETVRAFNRRQTHGPNPCLFHEGTLFAAPIDADVLLALDAETGILKWDRELKGHMHTVLGVGAGRLIVAGDQLCGLDAETGEIAWTQGTYDPAGFGYGRGLLAANVVYWPTREEIFVIDQATGVIQRRINLVERGLKGGNLTIARDLLLIAETNRLIALSQSGGLALPPRDEVAQK